MKRRIESRVFTLDEAPEPVLREWAKQMDAKLLAQRDEYWLGWWLVRNAARITVTLPWGATMTVAGPTAVQDVRRWLEVGQRDDDWRAA
jgi:hypothetical protein